MFSVSFRVSCHCLHAACLDVMFTLLKMPSQLAVSTEPKTQPLLCLCDWSLYLSSRIGGSNLRRRWRRGASGGANPTWPRCPCIVCLSCGPASRRAPSCWTWRLTHCPRWWVSKAAGRLPAHQNALWDKVTRHFPKFSLATRDIPISTVVIFKLSNVLA